MANRTADKIILEWLVGFEFGGTDNHHTTYSPALLNRLFDIWVRENPEAYDYEVFTFLATPGIRRSLDLEFITDEMNDYAWGLCIDELFEDE